MIVFDLNSEESFLNLDDWFDYCKKNKKHK